MKYLFFILFFISCRVNTTPTTEVTLNNRLDSFARALTDSKQEFKTSVTALSLTWYTKTEVDTKVAAAVKIPNDKIIKLVADTLLKSKQIKALQDTLKALKDSSVFISADFKLDKKRTLTVPKLPTIEARLVKLEAKP